MQSRVHIDHERTPLNAALRIVREAREERRASLLEQRQPGIPTWDRWKTTNSALVT